jgi:hypothetical protein
MDPETTERTHESGVPIETTTRPIVFTDSSTGVQAKIEEKAKKLNHSNYFLTCSTNETFSDFQKDEFLERAVQLEQAYTNVMEHIERYITFQIPGDSFRRGVVEKVEHEHVIERGPKYGNLHFHAIVKIAHRSRVKVDFELMKQHLSEALWGEGTSRRVYMWHSWFKETKIDLQSYIQKNYDMLKRKGIDIR